VPRMAPLDSDHERRRADVAVAQLSGYVDLELRAIDGGCEAKAVDMDPTSSSAVRTAREGGGQEQCRRRGRCRCKEEGEAQQGAQGQGQGRGTLRQAEAARREASKAGGRGLGHDAGLVPAGDEQSVRHSVLAYEGVSGGVGGGTLREGGKPHGIQ